MVVAIEPPVSQTAPKPALTLSCSEVWGGNRPIASPVQLPGLSGVLYSRPCAGGRGGDVHYLSVCGTGVLARACLADVVGHGEAVSAISSEIHAHLRRCMNQVDQRRVLAQLNRRLEGLGLRAMTTAAVITYYTPSRALWVSYAGHPPGWYYEQAGQRWSRLTPEPRAGGGFVDGPLAVDHDVVYTRRKRKAEVGDRIVLVTDGVLEAPDSRGELFGDDRMQAVLEAHAAESCAAIGAAVRAALVQHTGSASLAHDDVTLLIAEIVEGPAEPAFWLAVRNRLFPRQGNGESPEFSPAAQAERIAREHGEVAAV